MPRYRITIEYDGAAFVGWQAQAEGLAVQTAIEQAIFRATSESVRVKGAGRTDAGVHAEGQVGHFDLTREWVAFRIGQAINFHVRPSPVIITDCRRVSIDFDARFSATARHYRYRILTRSSPPVLDRGRVWWVSRTLDADAMAVAASMLVGRHDFTTFRANACQAKSPVRTLDRLSVARIGDEIDVRASARSFLHNQVRSMVGSLKWVGEGKWSADDMAKALSVRDRAACGPVAPAAGLYLLAVDYPAGFQRDTDPDADGGATAARDVIEQGE